MQPEGIEGEDFAENEACAKKNSSKKFNKKLNEESKGGEW